MDNQQLYALILGVVCVLALAVVAYANHTRRNELSELTFLLSPLVDGIVKQADVRLAAYGPALAPVHAVLETVSSLVDEDNDALVQAIKSPAVIAAIRAALAGGVALTDGIPAPMPDGTRQETLGVTAGVVNAADEAVG